MTDWLHGPASGRAKISARPRVFFAPDLSAPDLSRAWTLHRRDFRPTHAANLSSVICHLSCPSFRRGPGLARGGNLCQDAFSLILCAESSVTSDKSKPHRF